MRRIWIAGLVLACACGSVTADSVADPLDIQPRPLLQIVDPTWRG